jgi:hypothetical protein
MKDTRDGMYFPGAGGMQPMGGMAPGMGPGMMGPGMTPGMGPGMTGPGFQGGMPGMMPNIGQLETRIASLERQVRRLDARVGRLETPYPATTPQPFTGTTGDLSGAGEQPYTYPYQTSMQVM